MVTINNESTLNFNINGIDREKNYTPIITGNNIVIINAYDSKNVLLKSTPYTEFTINGNTYASPQEVVNALIPVIFTKDIVSSGGASATESTTILLNNAIEGVNHSATGNLPLTGALTIDLTGAVQNGFATVLYSGSANPTITVVNASSGETVEFKHDITQAGTYEITFVLRFGKILAFNPDASAGGGSTDTTAPTLSSATINDGSADEMVLVFSEAVNFTLAGWNLDTDGAAITMDTILSGNGTNTVTVGLSRSVLNTETLNVDYDPGTGNTVDLASSPNELTTVTDQAVVNLVGAVKNYTVADYTDVGVKSEDISASEPGGETVGLYGLAFNSDKSKFWSFWRSSKTLIEHSLSTNGDINTESDTGVSFQMIPIGTGMGVSMNEDDRCFYFTDYGNGRIYALPLATASQLNTNQYDVNNFWPVPETQPRAATVRNGFLYYAVNSDNVIRRRAITDERDMTTVAGTETDSYDAGAQIGSDVLAIGFSDDGLKMFLFETAAGNTEVYTIDLPSDGVLAGASYNSDTITVNENGEHRGFHFDGEKMYIGGRTGSFVYEYQDNS